MVVPTRLTMGVNTVDICIFRRLSRICHMFLVWVLLWVVLLRSLLALLGLVLLLALQ